MSSYLNKSRKTFKPKAQPKPPAQRTVARSEQAPEASPSLNGNAVEATTVPITSASDSQPPATKSTISSAPEHNLTTAHANSSLVIDLPSKTAAVYELDPRKATSANEIQSSAAGTQDSRRHAEATDRHALELQDHVQDGSVTSVVADSTTAVSRPNQDESIVEQSTRRVESAAQDDDNPHEIATQSTVHKREGIANTSAVPSIIPLPSARPRESAISPLTPPPSAGSAKRDRVQLVSEDTSAERPQKRQRTGEPSATISTGDMPRVPTVDTVDVTQTTTAPAATIPRGKRASKDQTLGRPDDKAKEGVQSRPPGKKTAQEQHKSKNARGQAGQELSSGADGVAVAKERSKRKSGGVYKRKRHGTPDGAEEHRIVPTETSMATLCVDPKAGKVSSREKKLRDRDKDNAEKRRQAAQENARRQARDFMNNPEGSPQSAEAGPSKNTNPPVESGPSTVSDTEDTIALSVPMTQIIDGQIVAVENSHIVDRHNVQKNPSLAFDENAPATVEDELSKRVNTASHTSRRIPTRWTAERTLWFYEGLRYFGMDFTTMETLFPGMKRIQLKKKFIKEQRADLNFINQVLKERKPVPTAEELQKLSGRIFRKPDDVYDELAKDKEELLEVQRKKDEAEEEARKERERKVQEEGARLGVDIAAKPPGQSSDEDSDDEEVQEENVSIDEQDPQDGGNPVKSIEDTVNQAKDSAKDPDHVSISSESDEDVNNDGNEVQDDETNNGDEAE